jgi:hypothetical protein
MRFLISNPPASDFELPDLEALLDALESALVTPETPVFDAVRQSWQPAGRHPEVRAAWAERARYLPPGVHRPQLPPPPREDPKEPSEQQQRRQAWEMMKQGHRPSRRRPRAPMVGVTVVILLLVLMAWGIVALAGGLSRVAGAVVRAEVGR